MFVDFRKRGEREGEGERGGSIEVKEKHHLIASLRSPLQGSNPQPSYVSQPGIELQPFWSPG